MGAAGRMPFAGLAWETLHYLEGFRRLDHDVYYIEDTGDWPYDPAREAITEDCRYTVNYLARLMKWCGLPDRWAYRARAQEGRIYGLSESQFKDTFQHADALINLTGATILHDEHLDVPIRVLLQTDPGAGEIRVAKGDRGAMEHLEAHTHFFNYGVNLGAPGCGLPPQPVAYHPTRAPIVLDWFTPPAHPPGAGNRPAAGTLRFTTVGNWKQTGEDIEWHGETYTWSKHHEFLKFVELPRRVEQPIELALASIDAETIRFLTSRGWRVVDACSLTTDILPYRDYIVGSDGEFTVAKDQNVRLRTGWFSERSASYLSSGKPVITQDTGFGRGLPTGEGLFPFNTMEEIVAAVQAIKSDYRRHCRGARAVAQEYFRAETVLAKLLSHLGV